MDDLPIIQIRKFIFNISFNILDNDSSKRKFLVLAKSKFIAISTMVDFLADNNFIVSNIDNIDIYELSEATVFELN